jgi:hypothetical protein
VTGPDHGPGGAAGPARLTQETDGRGRPQLKFANRQWLLRVDVGERLDPFELLHLGSGRQVADESYCYRLAVAGTTNSGFHGGPLACQRVVPIHWSLDQNDDDATLVLVGELDFGPNGPTGTRLEHRVTFTSAGRFVEQLSIVNHRGHDRLELSGLRFGLRKTLFDRASFSWPDGASNGQLIPVPFRRFAGQGTDHRLGAYSVADLYPDEWTNRRGLPGRSAEAWLWSEPGGGFLVAKYNQDHIEFSLADGEHVEPRGASGEHADLQLERLHSDRNLCLRFAGAGISKGCPEHARQLAPGQRIDFGPSIIDVFEGDWQEGYGRYKEVLRARGHKVPANYEPRVHWNELYQLGWRCGSNAPLQELPQLWEEAARARAAGAQTFYFDPGWDLFEGSAIWDTGRLGPVEDFIAKLRQDYGLELALHLMIVHTKSLEEDPAVYRRRPDGTIDLWVDSTPYVGGNVCPASPTWQRQKIDRLRALATAGVSFFMFDFLSYESGGLELTQHRTDAPRSCYSSEHGHQVPITREEHAEAIMTVVRAIKSEFPQVTIEAHDRISGEFLPLYYQHGGSNSHDELWGFEYMWDPYADLLSGKALSLYEYNLAYDIPLYLHINSAHDSPTMLAFWWYVSCCRHLGIGGLTEHDSQWARLVEAMGTYRRLQPWFALGRFVGLDVLTHLHILEGNGHILEGDRPATGPSGGSAVLTAYNLGAGPVTRAVRVDLSLLSRKDIPSLVSSPSSALIGFDVDDGALVINIELAALSPVVVEIGTGASGG